MLDMLAYASTLAQLRKWAQRTPQDDHEGSRVDF